MLHSADKEGNIIEVSDYWLEKMGYTREEAKANKVWSYLPPEYQERAIKQLIPMLHRQGFVKDVIGEYRKKDGTYIDILVNSIACYDENGDFSHSLTVCTDISEQNNIKEALEQSEKRYKVLVENSPQAIMVHADGKLVFANSTAIKLLGGENMDDLLQKSIMDLIHPEEQAVAKQRIQDLYTQKTDAPPKKCRFIRVGGETLYVEVLGSMINYEGKPAAQLVFRDITYEIEAKQKLVSQERVLKGANEAATHLLTEEDDKMAISKALRAILDANQADRAYIFENHKNSIGGLCVSQRFEVVKDDIAPHIDNPNLHNISYVDAGFGEWLIPFQNGEIIYGLLSEFPSPIQDFLEEQNILSLIIIPIFIKGKFWGILGLDDCTKGRSWSFPEVELLRNTANTIGSFIAKKEIEDCEDIEQEVSRILSEIDDTDTAIKQILKKIGQNLNWDIGELWIPNNPPTYLSLEYGWHNKDNNEGAIFDEFILSAQSFQYGLDEGIVGEAWSTAKPVWLRGIDPNGTCRRTKIAIEANIQLRVAVPIILDNTVLGILCLLSTQSRDVSDVYIRTFTSIGIQIGQYIKRKRAEKQYKNLVDAVPAVVWRLDIESFAYTYVSHQAEVILGYPAENWIGNSSFWLENIHPDDREYAMNYCGECTKNKIDHDFEYRMINKDGQIIWISDHVHVIVKDDKPVELVGLLIDITEQKKAEQALILSQERLKLAIEGTELGLWDWNIKDDTVYSNVKLAEMLGYTSVEMPEKFKPMFEWVHPEDRERVEQALSAHLIGETETYQDEFRLRTKSGEYKWLLDVGKLIERDKDGNPVRMLGVHRDIDQRKISDEQLRLNEERLRLSLNGIGVGIFDWNMEDDTFFINEGWEKTSGVSTSRN